MTHDRAITAAHHALAACRHMDEGYLQIWFTKTLGGKVDPIPGGLRLAALGTACPGRPRFREALADWADFVLATREAEPLAKFLQLIAARDQWARVGLIEAAVIATGGCWVPPKLRDEWAGSHLCEISLFGVLGRGGDPLDASRDWIAAASRLVRTEAA